MRPRSLGAALKKSSIPRASGAAAPGRHIAVAYSTPNSFHSMAGVAMPSRMVRIASACSSAAAASSVSRDRLRRTKCRAYST